MVHMPAVAAADNRDPFSPGAVAPACGFCSAKIHVPVDRIEILLSLKTAEVAPTTLPCTTTLMTLLIRFASGAPARVATDEQGRTVWMGGVDSCRLEMETHVETDPYDFTGPVHRATVSNFGFR